MKNIMRLCKKTVCILLSATIFLYFSFIFFACTDNNIYDGDLLRLHIRANSNSDTDQAVKLKVRDVVNEYISSNVDKTSFEEAYREISNSLDALSAAATEVLKNEGFCYTAKARLDNEYFPTRKYDDVTVPDGYYDALIIELGTGTGDNWWCVIYPPLCYGEDFEYKSIFKELFGGE